MAQGSSAAGASSASASGAAQRLPANRVTKPSSLSRRAATPATGTPRQERAKKDALSQKQHDTAIPAEANTQEQGQGQGQGQGQAHQEEQADEEEDKNHVIKSQYDNDPLLKSYIPPAPSERIMRALLAEPPLSYNASRAGPPSTGKSARHFCCICGYWGKIRCRNCHQRTCGIDCYKTHEDSRCGAFF